MSDPTFMIGDCCAAMRQATTLCCELHTDPMDCPDVLVVTLPTHGPGLPIRDGGSSISQINFCPWCGAALRAREA